MLRIAKLDAFYDSSQILHSVGIEVGHKERVAVLGRNGAGKSTLLKSILDAGPRVQGDVIWNDTSLRGLDMSARIRLGLALVPEDRRIFTHLTVAENIEFARFAMPPGRTAINLDEILPMFPLLVPLRDRPGDHMSGGEQQALAIARAMASRPDLMLLDEPTEGLAPVIVDQLSEIVTGYCTREGASILLCEQNIRFARACTERVYVIDTGRIVFSGTWHEFDADANVKQRHLAV